MQLYYVPGRENMLLDQASKPTYHQVATPSGQSNRYITPTRLFLAKFFTRAYNLGQWIGICNEAKLLAKKSWEYWLGI